VFRYYVGTLVFFCLSLLCKESPLTLPFVLFLYDMCFTDRFKRDTFRWKGLLIYAPFAVILLGYFVVRRLVIPDQSLQLMIHSFSDLASRVATIIVIVVSYWKLLLLPIRLTTERNVELVTSFLSPVFLLSLVFLIVALVMTVRWWRSDRNLFFCSMWFFILFAPVSNIIPIFPSRASTNLYCAEQLMYLPSMGFFFIAVSLVANAVGETRGRWRVFLVSFFLILFAFSVLSIRRTTDWRNSVSLYKSSLSVNPHSVRNMNNLGVHYLRNKQYQEAQKLFESVLAIDPQNVSAHNNLATIYEDHGLVNKAEALYRKVLSFSEKDIRARLALGRILAQTGRIDEARSQFALLAGWYPDLSVAHHELGRILAAEGKLAEALDRFQRALPDSPSPDVVLNSIGIIYARQGKLEQASQYFLKALEANPDSYQAHVNLGNIYLEQNLPEKALAEYENALRSGIALPMIEERIRHIRGRQNE
jgi:Tfp pilus assembly protein PilF